MPNAPTWEERLPDLRESVRRMIKAGFDTAEDILARSHCEVVGEFPELDDSALETTLGKIVEEEIQNHLLEQRNWPAITDCDRLETAFTELGRAGILARHNYSCCGTCGAAEARKEMEDALSLGKTVRGYTFYHVQDTESAVDGHGIGLSYGSVADGEAAALRIAHEVVDALARQGLRADWSGTWDQRIMLDIDWKRRWRQDPSADL